MKGRNRIIKGWNHEGRLLFNKKQAKDSTNKKELQKKRAQKYKIMDAFKKQRLSNNFEIFTLLKDDFCSVRLLHCKMLEKSPSSRSYASSLA